MNTAPETHLTNVSVYSPKSLVSIFEKAFILQEEKKIIQIKGVFLKAGTVLYNSGYYDKLKDEASDYSLTVVTSSLIHNELRDNTTIQFNGYLTRKIDKYGRLEFQINFIDLVNVTQNKFSDEDIKKIEIINLKLKSGIKDLDSSIKQHVYNNTKMKIIVIIGKQAIINNDITTALGIASVHYDLHFTRVSISSIKEITDEILKYDNANIDLICIARGGGEQMEAFSNPELVKSILNRKTIIASAIGHADDISLFEQVADKKFTTPSAFGAYLKQIYNETVEELAKSKAKMQKDITDQLKVIYDEQLKTLNLKLENTTKLYIQEKKSILESNEVFKRQLGELHEKKVKDLNEFTLKLRSENEGLARQLNDARKAPQTNYSVIIIVIIIVIVLAVILSQK